MNKLKTYLGKAGNSILNIINGKLGSLLGRLKDRLGGNKVKGGGKERKYIFDRIKDVWIDDGDEEDGEEEEKIDELVKEAIDTTETIWVEAKA